MFYVTGDVHGDIKGFHNRNFKKIKKNDFIVICGDFGGLWNGGREEQKACKSLGARRRTTLFIDGCHENYSLLNRYPVTEWNGGKVHVITGNLIHLMRGQVYTLGGKKIFTFGGGESEDREMRTPGETWWPEEMPSQAEMEEGIRNLVANSWRVDYIFTHEAPYSVKRIFEQETEEANPLHVYLDYINEKCSFDKWVFGYYHKTKRISNKHEAVFDGVLKLG